MAGVYCRRVCLGDSVFTRIYRSVGLAIDAIADAYVDTRCLSLGAVAGNDKGQLGHKREAEMMPRVVQSLMSRPVVQARPRVEARFSHTVCRSARSSANTPCSDSPPQVVGTHARTSLSSRMKRNFGV